MKNVNFILQAKGGVGKSMLTTLMAHSNINNTNVLYVDVDNSTQTSTKQQLFICDEQKETLSLLNEKQVLIRDKFLAYLESLTSTSFTDFFFDFGAPESEQFPALIERDIPFEEFLSELKLKAHFHIVIAGGGGYTASVEYLQKILTLIKDKFEITIWMNITSFNNFELLAKELESNCKKLNLDLKQFGDFDPNTDLGNLILDGIRKGKALDDYSIGAKYRLKMELKQNFEYGN